MRKRGEAKKEAASAARSLLDLSVSGASKDLATAKEQAALARRLMLKYNVRFRWSQKRFLCHGCKQLIVPGVNARVRVVRGVMLTTCAGCGRVNRKLLAQA